jgi:AcrR family transcriptional regulator
MTAQRTLRRAVSDEDKQRRRDEILGAAKAVFAEKGFHETTIADVARGTGLSYGVVYWYFESKEELFQALMTSEEEILRTRISEAAAAADTSDPVDRLRQSVRATFEHFEDDPAATRLLFRDTPSLGARFERELHSIFARFTSELETFLVAAQDRGLVRDGPVPLMAYSAAILIGQLALRRQRTDDGLTAGEAADLTVELLVDGLRSPDLPTATEPRS